MLAIYTLRQIVEVATNMYTCISLIYSERTNRVDNNGIAEDWPSARTASFTVLVNRFMPPCNPEYGDIVVQRSQ